MLEFSTLNFPLLTVFSISQSLWLIFFFALVFFAVTVFIFLYHFVSYGDSLNLTAITITLYVGGGIFILMIMYGLLSTL